MLKTCTFSKLRIIQHKKPKTYGSFTQYYTSQNKADLISSNQSLHIMQGTEKFIQSQEFKKNFPTAKNYVQKYSWLCLHYWMIRHSLIKGMVGPSSKLSLWNRVQAYMLRRSLSRKFEEYTRDHVYQYQEFFDRQVYEELKRIQNGMFWSLDQYFLYSNQNANSQEKTIQQIIVEDLNVLTKQYEISTENDIHITYQETNAGGKDTPQRMTNFQRIQHAQKIGKYLFQQTETIDEQIQKGLTNKTLNKIQWKVDLFQNY